MDALTQLAEVAARIAQRPALIRQARDEGATWEQIAAALNMSRAGVIKLRNSASRRQARCPAVRDDTNA